MGWGTQFSLTEKRPKMDVNSIVCFLGGSASGWLAAMASFGYCCQEIVVDARCHQLWLPGNE
jgi:hypothetical protein